jgi:hypothetical protein
MSSPTRALSVYSGDGLSNRLMLLLSGRALAQASGRAFEMHWYPKSTCNSRFDRLFDGDWGVREVTAFDASEWTDLRLYPPHKFPDLLQAPEPVLRIRHHNWLTRPELYPSHRPLQTHMHDEFRRMQPTPAIAERIQAFKAQNFRPTMIGVHLRRGDFDMVRPDRIENLDAAFAAVDAYLTRDPNAGILLCTDDGAPEPHSGAPSRYHGVREQFKERYGYRVVMTTPRSLDRDSPEAIQDAVMDLMLLRSTGAFVGTKDSTFSDFVVFGREIPFTITSGATAAYQARQQFLQRSGMSLLVRLAGRIEFGPNTPERYTIAVYKRRVVLLRNLLRRRGFGPEHSAHD